jgi:hypothetical protein
VGTAGFIVLAARQTPVRAPAEPGFTVVLEEKNGIVPTFRSHRIKFDKNRFRLNEDTNLEGIVGNDTVNSI